MARTQILKPDGTPTQYFWSDKDGKDLKEKLVFKETAKGLTRMKGVRFDAVRMKLRRD
jgi:hypothetical protein